MCVAGYGERAYLGMVFWRRCFVAIRRWLRLQQWRFAAGGGTKVIAGALEQHLNGLIYVRDTKQQSCSIVDINCTLTIAV